MLPSSVLSPLSILRSSCSPMSLHGALSQHERDAASRPPSPQAGLEALAEGDAGLRDTLVPADSRCLANLLRLESCCRSVKRPILDRLPYDVALDLRSWRWLLVTCCNGPKLAEATGLSWIRGSNGASG
jgi:hypothetical protein